MKRTECDHCQGAARTRRDFLRAGTLSFLGISLSDFLRFSSAAGSCGDCSGQLPLRRPKPRLSS